MTVSTHTPLDELRFDNRSTRALPADPSPERGSRQVPGAAYSRVVPRIPGDPSLIAVSTEMLAALGIESDVAGSPDFAAVFAGARVPKGADPHAAGYGGHQFGHWAGQLGDGRVINLGEVVGADGRHRMLQLKGAGPTPYSRGADGLAVLRSSVREFLCSEAMHHLGVPTTRALSLVATGDPVLRDMFYDGYPEYEPGAVVCRVAPSFTRFGTFQIFAARNEIEVLRRVVDHTMTADFPHLGVPGPAGYLAMYEEIVRRTAHLAVEWMRVGFVHGVLNTDNMSVLGLTIDYGPYGWLEGYDPDWTPNTTDAEGRRYRFANQPGVAQWNLMQLANALLPLLDGPDGLQEALDAYPGLYRNEWEQMMAAKLGLARFDGELVDGLFEVLRLTETDMTIFFRGLADVPVDDGCADDSLIAPISAAHYRPDEVTGEIADRSTRWLRSYARAVRAQGVTDRRVAMNRVNPRFLLRNYLAQLAIDASASGDHSLVAETLDVLRRPYDDQPGKEHFAAKRPDWARDRPGCSMLSCSS